MLNKNYHICLPISKTKYENLKTMCENIIPPRYHNEYLLLKHSAQIADVLDETDIEDET